MAGLLLVLAFQDPWALRPMGRPEPPRVAGVAHPIDAFIRARLEREGLKPAAEADRRTLIRRASFDLTGLPPEPKEIDAFLADAAPGAWERLIDRLLASPHHGERWGRHWLDVARYADTKGYVYDGREESRFVHSHVYRDWVIRALNEDMPYDRFLMLQLAADRLGGDRRDLAAMGFLTVGRRFINNVHDIIDDRIDTTTRGMLGLTVGCARCHDHKFDPIPTTDYYALYGIFAGSAERIEPLEPSPERTEAYVAFETERSKREASFAAKVAEKSAALLERLRGQTSRYLEAVLSVETLNTEEFYSFVGAEDVNPVIVRNWTDHLFRTRREFDPIFAPWHAGRAGRFAERSPRLNPRVAAALEGAATMTEVAARYGKLFEEIHAQAKGAGGPLPEAADEALRQVLYGPGSPYALPPGPFADFEWFFDEPSRVEMGKLNREIEKWILEAPLDVPHACFMADRPVQHPARVFHRGNPAQRGEEVPRRWLTALGGGAPFTEGSGRLELARAVADPENPLTSRVLVNRVWMHHFGEGLVRTPSDFGARSEAPTHPELLDWLARRFLQEGRSLKALHRLILTSATWRQVSGTPPDRDPENRLWSRMNRRRLEFEAMRDAILAASGTLDAALGGRGVDIVSARPSMRRTVYGFVDRLNLPGVFRAFDCTGADAHQPQRHMTTVPQQALFFLNSPFMIGQARALASRVKGDDPRARADAMIRRVYGREAEAGELELALAFVAGVAAPDEPPPEPTEWSFGYGGVDEAAGRLAGFTPLPHFTGDAWQGGPKWPDPTLGWVTLNARGGHTGNDAAHAAVRRWTAPRDVTVEVRGTVAHRRAEGDGVRARLFAGSELARWMLHNREAAVEIKPVKVKKGETLDFVVDCGSAGEITWDEFVWEIVLKAPDAEWSSVTGFRGVPSEPMGAWERLAQALLVSNEMVFVD